MFEGLYVFSVKKRIYPFKFIVEGLANGQYCIPPNLYSKYGCVILHKIG